MAKRELNSSCSVLLDETTNRTGDLYIRSICFSPDGKFLATGAEDRQIRVSPICPCTYRRHRLTALRSGTSSKNVSATCCKATCKKSTRSTFRETDAFLSPDRVTSRHECGILKRALAYLTFESMTFCTTSMARSMPGSPLLLVSLMNRLFCDKLMTSVTGRKACRRWLARYHGPSLECADRSTGREAQGSQGFGLQVSPVEQRTHDTS
jgi:hypothetical protein